MHPHSKALDQLVAEAQKGNQEALNAALAACRSDLVAMVRFRLDRRLQGRVDASDVVQDALLEASRRIDQYMADDSMPFFLWLRWLVRQRMIDVGRQHLGAKARDVRREAGHGASENSSGAPLVEALCASIPSPSEIAGRQEIRGRVSAAVESLRPLDRQILTLRAFEGLSNQEASTELGIDKDAASRRFVRALQRLSQTLKAAGLGTTALRSPPEDDASIG